MTIILLACVCIVTLCLSAFCSGTETGLTSVSRGRILHMAREGSKAAKIVQAALSDMARTVTALLVGNNLVNVSFSAASAALAARLFSDSATAQAVWGFCAACAVLTFGEFLPKLFCSARPLRRTLRLAPIFRVFDWLLTPLTALAMMVTGLFTSRARTHERVTPDELLRILRDRKDGVRLTDFESAIIARILVLRVKGQPVTVDAILSAIDADESDTDK